MGRSQDKGARGRGQGGGRLETGGRRRETGGGRRRGAGSPSTLLGPSLLEPFRLGSRLRACRGALAHRQGRQGARSQAPRAEAEAGDRRREAGGQRRGAGRGQRASRRKIWIGKMSGMYCSNTRTGVPPALPGDVAQSFQCAPPVMGFGFGTRAMREARVVNATYSAIGRAAGFGGGVCPGPTVARTSCRRSLLLSLAIPGF